MIIEAHVRLARNTLFDEILKDICDAHAPLLLLFYRNLALNLGNPRKKWSSPAVENWFDIFFEKKLLKVEKKKKMKKPNKKGKE